MTPTPIGLKIIVKPLERKEQKIGGVIVPGTTNADLSTGKIVAVSDQLKDVYKVGEIAIYASHAGVGQIINSEPHLWLNHGAEEIWGIDPADDASSDLKRGL